MNFSLKNKKLIFVLKVFIVVVLVSFLANLLFSRFMQERLEVYINSIGVFGPLILIFYMVISHVFAPLAGAPAVIVGYTAFGLIKTSIYLYIASIISATANFIIARKFGRKLVMRFVGQKSMKEIDNYIDNFGIKLLIFARVFGFAFFELISYAAGFTNISFKKYLFITGTFILIPMGLIMYLFKDTNFNTLSGPALWIGVIIGFGMIFTVLIKFIFTRDNK